MIDFRLSSVAAPTAGQLADFKAFIAANGAETDAFLLGILKRAMMAVQAWDDRTLLASTAVLTITGREDGTEPVLLYGSPASVTSVLDGDGNAVAYSLAGRTLYPAVAVYDLAVTYTTAAADADLEELLPKVYRYGAAIYNGEDSPTLARILQER